MKILDIILTLKQNNYESEDEVAEYISDQLMHNYTWSVFEQHGCL